MAAVVASSAVLAGCTTAVLHGLDEQSANEAVGALDRAGIAAEKLADDGLQGTRSFTLRVSRADGSRALEALRVQGLPRERRHGFAEVYGEPSLIPTSSEERARYLAATAGEIERTLETAEGIVSARVHLVPRDSERWSLGLPDDAPVAGGASGARAAVLLKTTRGAAGLTAAEVQRLVAGSVPGLAPEAVTVVVTAAPLSPGAAALGLAAVGPLRVAPASRGPLIAVFAGSLVVIAGLAATLFLSLRRRPLPPPGA